MAVTIVIPKALSCPKSLLTKSALERDPLQMIRFNVIAYVVYYSLLSTNFANVKSPPSMFSIGALSWSDCASFFHQGFHFEIKVFMY